MTTQKKIETTANVLIRTNAYNNGGQWEVTAEAYAPGQLIRSRGNRRYFDGHPAATASFYGANTRSYATRKCLAQLGEQLGVAGCEVIGKDTIR